jgi:hypothetical protein
MDVLTDVLRVLELKGWISGAMILPPVRYDFSPARLWWEWLSLF